MPLPFLVIPIAVTVGSAAVQAVGKLRARKDLNSLRTQLTEARARHRHLLTEYYLRHHFLCRQLGLEPPDKPESLMPPEPDNAENEGRRPLWRRVIPLKPKTTLTQGSTGSARQIVGRHSFSAATSVVWKTSSANILRVVEPVGTRLIQPVGSRLVTIAPRFVTLGGGAASTGGSLAASTAARTVIASVSVVGIAHRPRSGHLDYCQRNSQSQASPPGVDHLAGAAAQGTGRLPGQEPPAGSPVRRNTASHDRRAGAGIGRLGRRRRQSLTLAPFKPRHDEDYRLAMSLNVNRVAPNSLFR